MVEVLRVKRPFWTHQLVEYLIGMALISVGIQSPDAAVPAVMGLVVILNAAIAIGPAGAFRLVNRQTHRMFDLVVMALLVAAAVQPLFSVDNVTRMLLVVVAFVMFFIWFHTDFDTRRDRKARRAKQPRPSSEEYGRQAGRLVGGGVKAVRDQWKARTEDTDSNGGSEGDSS